MKIELIQGTLEVGEKPGLDITDPRFTDIATLVQEGSYLEAAAGAEAILEDHIYDIRMIGYVLYGHFMEEGIPALTDIYRSLADLLGENLEALGPTRNRARHIQTILNWLVRQILKTLQYEEGRKSRLYEDWVSSVSSDSVRESLEAGEKLSRVLGATLEDAAAPVLEGLGKISDWLKAFERLVYRAPEPATEEAHEEYPPKGNEPSAPREEKPGEGKTGQEEGRPASIPDSSRGEKADHAEGSYHLTALLRKLEVFDELISKGKYPSAAIVADDVNAIIADFDPRIYFPKLFTPFVRQSAAHIHELTAFEEYKTSAAWQSLKDLYRVDLESFVDFDPALVGLDACGGSGGHEYPGPRGDSSEDEDQYREDSSDQESDETW